jgi:PAS domain S-box-containing protein
MICFIRGDGCISILFGSWWGDMKEDNFDRKVGAAQEHLTGLGQHLDDMPQHERQPSLVEAVDELSVALEELHVASEELHQQNEELATAREHSEVERHRYQELFEFAPEGYLVTDPDGGIREANRAAAVLLSVPQGFLIGKPVTVFVNEGDRKSFLTQLNRLAKVERLEDLQIHLQPRDGEPFPAAITIGTMRDPDGKLIGLRWLIHNIAERKRMEEELRESENRLLLLSKRLLNVQEEERKSFAWDVHDSLGAVLAAVKFNIEAAIQRLRSKGKTEEAALFLRNALDSIQSTIEETRRIYTDLRPSVLDDLGIKPTVNWFTREYHNAYPDITVEKEITVEEHEVPDRLKIILYRVMQEAFANTAKHSKGNLIRVSLRKKGKRIEMVIRDNGVGFDAKDVLPDSHTGPGPGLSRMRERIELSGGALKIESSKKMGTTITASWPI